MWVSSLGGFISNKNILKGTPKFQTCVCWNDFSRFLNRDGRTKSQPLARKANSPLKSGSLRKDASLIIIFEKWTFTSQLSSTLLKIVRFNKLSILSGRKVFFSSYLPRNQIQALCSPSLQGLQFMLVLTCSWFPNTTWVSQYLLIIFKWKTQAAKGLLLLVGSFMSNWPAHIENTGPSGKGSTHYSKYQS